MSKINLLSISQNYHRYNIKTFETSSDEFWYNVNFLSDIKKIFKLKNKKAYDFFLSDLDKNFKYHIIESAMFWKKYELNLYPLDIQIRFLIKHLLNLFKEESIQLISCYDKGCDLYALWIEYYDKKENSLINIINSECIFVNSDKDVVENLGKKINEIFYENKIVVDSYYSSEDKKTVSIFVDFKKDVNEEQIENLTKYFLRVSNSYSSSSYFAYCFDDDYSSYKTYKFGEVNEFKKESKNSKDENIDKEKQENKSNKKVFLKDIAGLQNAKESFYEKIVLPIKHKDIYQKYNKKTGGGILLYGLPGTGKTLFAEAVSNEIEAKFFSIKVSDIESKWVGESERNIRELFEKAREAEKAIIFIDEFEAIGGKRASNVDRYHAANHTVPELLAQMQGVNTNNENVLVIAATNRPWEIDSALLRPGRFDVKIHVPLPDFEARLKMFEIYLSKIDHMDLDYQYLSKITDGYNGADIKEFVEQLKMSVIRRKIENEKAEELNSKDIDVVAKKFKPSVSLEDIELIKDFENKFSSN